MRGRGRRARRRERAEGREVEQALDAMSAPELRAAVRAVLDELNEDVKTSVVDTLIGRATKASSGWMPPLDGRAQGMRRVGEDGAPDALARRTPRRGRTRRSGAWPV